VLARLRPAFSRRPSGPGDSTLNRRNLARAGLLVGVPGFAVVNQPGQRDTQRGQVVHIGDLTHEDAAARRDPVPVTPAWPPPGARPSSGNPDGSTADLTSPGPGRLGAAGAALVVDGALVQLSNRLPSQALRVLADEVTVPDRGPAVPHMLTQPASHTRSTCPTRVMPATIKKCAIPPHPPVGAGSQRAVCPKAGAGKARLRHGAPSHVRHLHLGRREADRSRSGQLHHHREPRRVPGGDAHRHRHRHDRVDRLNGAARSHRAPAGLLCSYQ